MRLPNMGGHGTMEWFHHKTLKRKLYFDHYLLIFLFISHCSSLQHFRLPIESPQFTLQIFMDLEMEEGNDWRSYPPNTGSS